MHAMHLHDLQSGFSPSQRFSRKMELALALAQSYGGLGSLARDQTRCRKSSVARLALSLAAVKGDTPVRTKNSVSNARVSQ
jgi:hypothetical protein